jgi:hypothetical protein
MKTRLTTLLIAAGLSASALAQERESPLPEFGTIDENEDGLIDQAEAKLLLEALEEAGIEFEFETVDANMDGAIDLVEYAEYEEALLS